MSTVVFKKVVFGCQKIFGSPRFEPGISPNVTVFTKGPRKRFGDTKVSKFEFKFAVHVEFEIEFTVLAESKFKFTVGLQTEDKGLGALR